MLEIKDKDRPGLYISGTHHGANDLWFANFGVRNVQEYRSKVKKMASELFGISDMQNYLISDAESRNAMYHIVHYENMRGVSSITPVRDGADRRFGYMYLSLWFPSDISLDAGKVRLLIDQYRERLLSECVEPTVGSLRSKECLRRFEEHLPNVSSLLRPGRPGEITGTIRPEQPGHAYYMTDPQSDLDDLFDHLITNPAYQSTFICRSRQIADSQLRTFDSSTVIHQHKDYKATRSLAIDDMGAHASSSAATIELFNDGKFIGEYNALKSANVTFKVVDDNAIISARVRTEADDVYQQFVDDIKPKSLQAMLADGIRVNRKPRQTLSLNIKNDNGMGINGQYALQGTSKDTLAKIYLPSAKEEPKTVKIAQQDDKESFTLTIAKGEISVDVHHIKIRTNGKYVDTFSFTGLGNSQIPLDLVIEKKRDEKLLVNPKDHRNKKLGSKGFDVTINLSKAKGIPLPNVILVQKNKTIKDVKTTRSLGGPLKVQSRNAKTDLASTIQMTWEQYLPVTLDGLYSGSKILIDVRPSFNVKFKVGHKSATRINYSYTYLGMSFAESLDVDKSKLVNLRLPFDKTSGDHKLDILYTLSHEGKHFESSSILHYDTKKHRDKILMLGSKSVLPTWIKYVRVGVLSLTGGLVLGWYVGAGVISSPLSPSSISDTPSTIEVNAKAEEANVADQAALTGMDTTAISTKSVPVSGQDSLSKGKDAKEMKGKVKGKENKRTTRGKK